MARIAIMVVPGYPHRVTQRGCRRQQAFLTPAEYRRYFELLKNRMVDAGILGNTGDRLCLFQCLTDISPLNLLRDHPANPARRSPSRIISSLSLLRKGQRSRSPNTVRFGASSSSFATAAAASSMRSRCASAEAMIR